MTDDDARRCSWALPVRGVVVRCVLREGHDGLHQGKLPRGSRFKTVLWVPGDKTERDTREGGPDPHFVAQL